METTANDALEDVHKVPKVDVVDPKGLIVKAPWQKRTIETGAAVVAHVIDEGAGFKPVSSRADFIIFKDLEFGPELQMWI